MPEIFSYSYMLGNLEDEHTLMDNLENKGLNHSTDCTEHGGHIQQWNPMEADFLASKNNYAYDDEDASIVIQGYSKLC